MPTRTDIPVLGLLLLVACGQGEDPPAAPSPDGPPPPAELEPEPTAAGQSAWAAELARVDERIAVHTGRMAERESWLEGASAASFLQQRARLSGELSDYVRAEELLTRAFTYAPEGSGPFLQRARLHFTLHRLPQAEEDLATVEAQPLKPAETLTAIADLRADIALERGQLDVAEAHWEAAEAARPSLQTAAALGRISWQRGQFEAADALFVRGLERYHGAFHEPVAWVHLQRGLIDLDQGDAAAALVHYAEADAALAGYWLVEEHQAEALLLTGETERALALYRDVVARTGSPELQGALAELLLEQGQEAEARDLVAQADATYAEQLALFPEAATGHALDHVLTWGEDPARALELAERNAELRPHGAALAQLSQARLAAGDAAGALKAAEEGLATGTRSAELFLAAAAAAQASGAAEQSASYLAQAQEIDPSAALEG